MTPVRAIEERGPSLAVIGRIRLGVFTGNHPKATPGFVLTAPMAETLAPLAVDYGGTVEPYTPQGQSEDAFRLVTDRSEIIGMFPAPHPDDVFDQWYELWTAAGRVRRCDGDLCEFVDLDTGEMGSNVPCICTDDPDAPASVRECAIRTRLRLWLPQTVGIGVWEVSTNSVWAAFDVSSQLRVLHGVLGDLRSAPVALRYLPRQIRYRDADGKRHRTTKRVISLDLALHVAELRRLDRDPLAIAETVLGRYGRAALPSAETDAVVVPPNPGHAGGGPSEPSKQTSSGTARPDDAGGRVTGTADVESGPDASGVSSGSDSQPALDDDPTAHTFVGDSEYGPCGRCGFAIEAHRKGNG